MGMLLHRHKKGAAQAPVNQEPAAKAADKPAEEKAAPKKKK